MWYEKILTYVEFGKKKQKERPFIKIDVAIYRFFFNKYEVNK